jgi:hypothetical protein
MAAETAPTQPRFSQTGARISRNVTSDTSVITRGRGTAQGIGVLPGDRIAVDQFAEHVIALR